MNKSSDVLSVPPGRESPSMAIPVKTVPHIMVPTKTELNSIKNATYLMSEIPSNFSAMRSETSFTLTINILQTENVGTY